MRHKCKRLIAALCAVVLFFGICVSEISSVPSHAVTGGPVLDLEEDVKYFGRTYADSPEIDGRVWIATEEPVSEGNFLDVCIDGLIDGDLSGYIVEE